MQTRDAQVEAKVDHSQASPLAAAEGNAPATGITKKQSVASDFNTSSDPYPRGIDPDLLDEINEELAELKSDPND